MHKQLIEQPTNNEQKTENSQQKTENNGWQAPIQSRPSFPVRSGYACGHVLVRLPRYARAGSQIACKQVESPSTERSLISPTLQSL